MMAMLDGLEVMARKNRSGHEVSGLILSSAHPNAMNSIFHSGIMSPSPPVSWFPRIPGT
jgi:hypothetical protein